LQRQWWKPRRWWLKGRPLAELHDSLECNGHKNAPGFAQPSTMTGNETVRCGTFGAQLLPHVGHPTRHGRTAELGERNQKGRAWPRAAEKSGRRRALKPVGGRRGERTVSAGTDGRGRTLL
jgi:hypothetical protein